MFDRPLDCLVLEAEAAGPARLVVPVTPQTLAAAAQAHGVSGWVAETGFAAAPGEIALLPGADGVAGALLGVSGAPGQGEAGPLDGPAPFDYAGLPDVLPGGAWRIEGQSEAAVLGFCLGAYRYTRLLSDPPRPSRAVLIADPDGVGASEARATWLARDLINTPANLLGPDELAAAAAAVCDRFGAASTIVSGDVLARAYPAIEAVGRGSRRKPLVFHAAWRGEAACDDAPLVCLVGKGVCFDTGGYDLKPAAAMLRMKKDMGGAAIMLGLARLIMQRNLPIRLELRLGCVENSISGEAMRPSDVIATRKGLSVEVGNTDAEGRLVLCDLLAEACEQAPATLLDAATLTGAARVALGPDLPALFCNDEALAASLLEAGEARHDPLWRLPLHDGYESWLSSSVADLNNVSFKPMAGAVVAALFLRRFVSESIRWAHIDTYAWSDSSRPGRPEGADAQGLRALYHGLLQSLNL